MNFDMQHNFFIIELNVMRQIFGSSILSDRKSMKKDARQTLPSHFIYQAFPVIKYSSGIVFSWYKPTLKTNKFTRSQNTAFSTKNQAVKFTMSCRLQLSIVCAVRIYVHWCEAFVLVKFDQNCHISDGISTVMNFDEFISTYFVVVLPTQSKSIRYQNLIYLFNFLKRNSGTSPPASFKLHVHHSTACSTVLNRTISLLRVRTKRSIRQTHNLLHCIL